MRKAAIATGSIRLFFSPPDHSSTQPAVFVDRDGVINEKIAGGYVTGWRSFRFIPGITEALQALSSLGLPVIVVSNQAGVGKGLMGRRALGQVTRRFVTTLRKEGARIDAVYYCPHAPDAGCNCRKPRPGLLEQAAEDWGVDLSRSVLIGDSQSDLEAAAAAGCRAVIFTADSGEQCDSPSIPNAVRNVSDLAATVAGLLKDLT
jgi:D-glycero-D-manno-heptose 1,7-bisphosphate phosphatase